MTKSEAEDNGWRFRESLNGYEAEKTFRSGFRSQPVSETLEGLLTFIYEMEKKAIVHPTLDHPVGILTNAVFHD